MSIGGETSLRPVGIQAQAPLDILLRGPRAPAHRRCPRPITEPRRPYRREARPLSLTSQQAWLGGESIHQQLGSHPVLAPAPDGVQGITGLGRRVSALRPAKHGSTAGQIRDGGSRTPPGSRARLDPSKSRGGPECALDSAERGCLCLAFQRVSPPDLIWAQLIGRGWPAGGTRLDIKYDNAPRHRAREA